MNYVCYVNYSHETNQILDGRNHLRREFKCNSNYDLPADGEYSNHDDEVTLHPFLLACVNVVGIVLAHATAAAVRSDVRGLFTRASRLRVLRSLQAA